MERKSISVIVPVYNVEKYLNRCLNSIKNQTYSNIEILIIDDGATDNSSVLCDQSILCDERIVVIHQYNKGLAGARNSGLKVCNGEYISFIDSDDWIDKDMLFEIEHAFNLYHCDIVICDYQDEFDDGSITERYDYTAKDEMDLYQYCNYVLEKTVPLRDSVCNKVFTRECINGFWFDEQYRLGEDCLFLFESCGRVRKVIHINRILYHYYCRQKGLSKITDISKRITTITAHKKIVELSKSVGLKTYQLAEANYLDFCLQYIEHKTAKKALRNYILNNSRSFILNKEIWWKLKIIYVFHALRNNDWI